MFVICTYVNVNSGLWIPGLRSRTANQISDRGKNVKESINGPTVEEANVASLHTMGWEREGPLRISTGKMIAAQVHMSICDNKSTRIIM
jgi:hypothetical protein